MTPTKTYILRNARNQDFESPVPGTLGGNSGLRIYGTLDCPSANRWLSKGHYKAVRVFFADKQTAIAAGYRPCGVCCTAEYIEWQRKQPRP